ncbi:PREDICTED: SAC3 family protein C [Lupinus angustifolius]|uniref:SAC3 family protein C n=1 Tax=Lupinus angustifolius TaxID=3871 RepID=UPI00092F2A39|nr:PREDICTED: SAC3 family protein C [Lupinus angustifolius]
MEGGAPRNRNPSSHSVSTSFSQSSRSNATHQSKVSTFAQIERRGRASSSSTSYSNINTQHYADADSDSNFVPLVGTCPYMCPEGERIQRENLRDLAVFERLNGNPRKSSPGLAVKKFCRTISSKCASDVRPLPVLEDTLKYLLSFLESKEKPFEVVHDFVFDRTRSIRQDLTMQNIVNTKAIYMYEGMVKFHVVSHHKLRHSMSDPNIASMHHLNMEQLTKTLASLFSLYEANRNSNYVHENEAEFHSLNVLLHLGSYSKPMGEPLSLWFSRLSPLVLKSKEMRFARRILRSFRLGNYKDFFCTAAAQASYLQYCIMEPYINEVRALALSCINFGGYKLHPYPLFELSKQLMIKESDLETFCKSCGLETCTDESGNKLLPTKQDTFSHPKGGFQIYSFLGFQEYESQF